MSIASKIPLPVYISSAICGLFGVSVLIKQKTGGDYYEGPTRAEGKVVIVTGANSGIGKETVWELARRGAKVYMACKDMERCEEARKDIVLDTKNKYIYCRSCDLASLDSIRKFVNCFKSEEQKLDILVNNAGVMRTPKGSKTKEGFEMQLGVNHLGHFLLTNLLLDYLKKSAPSRIINLSCISYKRGKINKDDLNSTLSYDPATAYEQSKLANVLFTKELAAKLAGSGVTVNVENPGVVDTDLVRHMGFSKSSFASIIFKPLTWPFVRSPRQGCQGVVYLALDPALERISGQYFSNIRVEEVSREAADSELGKWLWRVSEKWTRLTSVS
ncbi:retinol dehydrogenase 13-like [Euwallacea similis]|uniref:retinol dehydrogenase 13-like n=1 Tax=Euwallacea similis TaxID=1736056 RepID=UPI00344D7845